MNMESAVIVRMVSVAGILVFCLLGAWLIRVGILAQGFLRLAAGVIENPQRAGKNNFFFYRKDELRGVYKGREAVIGVFGAGTKGEIVSYPYIALRLREAMGYNLNRLPHYAVIEKGCVVYSLKFTGLLGVFEKSYPQLFSRNYLIIALDRLLATAEDLERGRTYKEIF